MFKNILKYQNLILVLFSISSINIYAQIFSDNFDSYIANNQLCSQTAGAWQTWSGPSGGIEDPYVRTTHVFSPLNSINIVTDNDLVRFHDNKTLGKWYISFMFYIPSGKSGYFNTMAVFNPPSNFSWAFDVYFDVGGNGRIMVPGNTINFEWTEGYWNQIMILINFDASPTQAQFWIGTGYLTRIAAWDYTGIGTVPDQLAATDFFGATLNDDMYIDNFYFGDANTFQFAQLICNSWNMLSIPGLLPTDQSPDTWWPFKVQGSLVYYYDADPRTPQAGFQALLAPNPTQAVPGIGYWIKHNGERTYNTGDEWSADGILPVPHNPIPAFRGWNLIGPYEHDVYPSDLYVIPNITPNITMGTVFRYGDNSSCINSGYNQAPILYSGFAYWIKLTGPPEWDGFGWIDHIGGWEKPVGEKSTPETTEFFKEDWGKIILTDATGINYTLYAVKGETDLSQYELPPKPPEGMLDIRFQSGRIAEDINSAIQAIEMSGVTYPLTVRIEGMDIRLMDETGKAVNINLKSGEEILINDARICKLKVTGELIPTVYALKQNYPNPFNPSTMIEFSLPEDVANVKLSIYNALGEKVAELVNTSLQAGKYQYQWNAMDVATGTYIYELRTDKFVSVKKMILLK